MYFRIGGFILFVLTFSWRTTAAKYTTTLEPFLGGSEIKTDSVGESDGNTTNNHTFFYLLLDVMSKTKFPQLYSEHNTSDLNDTASQQVDRKKPIQLINKNVSSMIDLLIFQHVMENIKWNSSNVTSNVKQNETDESEVEIDHTPNSLLNAILEVMNKTIRPIMTTTPAPGTPLKLTTTPAPGTPLKLTTTSAPGTPLKLTTTSAPGTPLKLTTTSAPGTPLKLTTTSAPGTPLKLTTTSAQGTPLKQLQMKENNRSLSEIKEEVNSLNASDIDLETMNGITSEIQNLVETRPHGLHEVTRVLAQLSEVTATDTKTVQMYTTIFTNVIETEINHTEEDKKGLQDVVPDLMFSMENVLSSTLPSESVTMSTPEIEVSTTFFHSQQNKEERMVIQTIIGTVSVPIFVFGGQATRISTIVYRSVHKTIKVEKGYTHAQVASNVMSVSLQRLHNDTSERLKVNTENAITMVLPTDVNGKEKKRLCTFWNFEKRFWDTTGSELIEKNSTHTKCHYNHLTNFAVLVIYHKGPELTNNQKHVLEVLTTVGCSLSIACLGVTLITYLYLRVLSNEKMLIHANLSVSMILAQFVLVTSQDTEDQTAACKVVAILLHFLFMAMFSWMLVEGLSLYLACTRSFYNYGDMRIKYFLLGWGMPAVIVLISVGTQFPHYGPTTDESCWLSAKDGLIWAFMGPMFAIVFFNILILGLVIRVFLKLKSNSRKSDSARFRASVKAVVTLVPLLGTTWIIGLFVPFHAVFHYLFVIGNSMQGMLIFVLHCICNEEVRKRMSEKRRQFPSNGVSASDTDISEFHHRPRKFLDFTDLSIQHAPKLPDAGYSTRL